ncbi:hypothetical protein ACFOKJ_03310 [Vogesella amnigena]|uniref:Helicase n=1 Tax=Vogesella amnigena TaxID=1507449 RepID=A0ABV7TR25_9NEIS
MPGYAPRDSITTYLRSVLFGPTGGETEQITGTPFLRYLTGILFPAGVEVEETIQAVTATADEFEAQTEHGDESTGDQGGGIDLAAEALPAAVGISFKVSDSSEIRCNVWAARYEQKDEDSSHSGRGASVWNRRPLASKDTPEVVLLKKTSGPVSVLEGRAKVVPCWRSLQDGTAIVTIALVNTQHANKRGPDPALSLFQVGMRCEVEDGILPYPKIGTNHDPESEEAEVEFLYRSVQPFARGHGAAADWNTPIDGRSNWVSIDFIPSVDVPKATFELTAPDVHPNCCDLTFLVNADRPQVITALRSLITAYSIWVEKQNESVPNSSNPKVAKKFAARASDWLRRMSLGVDLLENNEIAWQCFRLANEAMAMQMVLIKERPKIPYKRSEHKSCPPFDFKGRSWRPFQIAFLIATIESLVNQGSADRDIVDVIWFPTGGGKTEAYLLVSAFELIRRRLVHGTQDTGTAILSRYTLRFLTAQQFQRTSALIVALEMLRRKRDEELGHRPFSLGLWVGESVTPNQFRKAHEKLQEQLESRNPKNGFLLQACPCCGTEIFPTRMPKGQKKWSQNDFGVIAQPDKFIFRCVSDSCEFKEELPLNVVDEALYQTPPSLLLGTVDKFAMLPWDDRARVFFGGQDDSSIPPSLILQDELHLISGPLGSLAAPYDAAIDAVIAMREGKAKRIGSTATIRNAHEQVRGLYGREVSVFPSPGSRWDDAFFFSTDHQAPGRTYLGVMGQGYIKPVVAMAWTSAALLQSVREVPLSPEALDSYWTLLAYHNSRRELGRTLTAARDEVQARIAAIASSTALARTIGEPLELSAQMVKSLGEAIEALEKPYTSDDPPVDLVPCTSIISVGVDLDRLGIMLMNGQPKLTSEYIQATSRVGRGKVPGLVVSLFSASKPRDRSHYEDFRAYHEAIYRHVEPTSVTPYALPARERTLHAALVAAIRHGTGFRSNDAAKNVDFSDPKVRDCVQFLLEIMCACDKSEASHVSDLMNDRMQEWQEVAESGFPLLYERRQVGSQFAALLTEYGKAKAGACWPTMMSVRNVDAEVRIKVV